MVWPRPLIALNARNYRLFFLGQIISLIGTWMTTTASLWLMYRLSSSTLMLGLLGFCNQAPIFFCAPFAGVWVDRLNRHRLLITTQVLAMAQSLALAALALSHLITVPLLIGLTLLKGFINGFDMPTRQALVIAFVERREHLGNAIALNSSMFNLARLLGPAIAGFVIQAVGVGGCFLIDGISYLAVVVCLLLMRIKPQMAVRAPKHPWVEMQEGFAYALGLRPVRALIATVALVSFAGFSYVVLTPVYARDIFHGDARTLGSLMSATGVGAVLAAIYLGSRRATRGLDKVIALGAALMGIALLVFAVSRFFALSLLAMALAGMGGVLVMASSNTLLQMLIQEEKRGRVMSIFAMAFTGTMPLGNLVVGAVARATGVTLALGLAGVVSLLVGLDFYRQVPALRAAAGKDWCRTDKVPV